jgi:polyhydroxyalkanoate synthase
MPAHTAASAAPQPVEVPAADGQLADQAAPLDALLVDATLGNTRRFATDLSAAKFAAGLGRRPLVASRRLGGLAAELVKITAGASTLAPAKRDRRFADPAWTQNPVLRRIVQAYLAAGRTVEGLVDDAALDSRDDRRVRFGVENLVEALSPSNVPLLNPASAKAAIDSGGLNFVHGARSLLRDMASPPRIPEMVDTSAFEVGGNLAVTPGSVVLRTPVLELIQYRPQSGRVRDVPLLIVPPTINKFYVLDLAPGRSMVEYLVRDGQQVFVISWRNPDARHAHWGLDTYVQEVLGALDAVERISGSDRTALLGVCAGGIIASITAAYLAATGAQDRLACLSLLVTVLDSADGGTVGALVDRPSAAVAKAVSARRGYLDGRALAEVFAWLRPGDLVWNYWVNNYLLGKKPPAFDVLFWNADSTRMTSSLHADFVGLSMDNLLVTPGALTVQGIPIDLSKVSVDTYLVAGVADHITPWQSCYRSTQLLGGESRFVLSTSGHIAALVNPPDSSKATYQVSDTTPADPADWLQAAQTQPGSWWPDLAAWLHERCGPDKRAPRDVGGGGLRSLAAAPGTYVFGT